MLSRGVRARGLGIPFDGAPGPLNAITDVAGIEAGHTTLIRGQGRAAIRTGVTAILPRGKRSHDPVFAGWFSLNGNGEMTGTTWIEESGLLSGPIMITNTHSVGVVRDAVIAWLAKRGRLAAWALPVVAETYDGWLNDINGFHVEARHAFVALDRARGGAVAEGNVGGGTGMIGYEFKGGIGTASRRLEAHSGGYTLGVLVQLNCGMRRELTIVGVPIGRELPHGAIFSHEQGSIIIVIATDAPLLPHQLKRLARRAALGLARTGSVSGNGSGDIFIAFSTAPAPKANERGIAKIAMLANERMNPLFTATVQATEEAIINALVAARTMVGREEHRVEALPHDAVRGLMRKYGRLPPS